MKAENIADAVWYVASRPPRINIFDMIVTPTAQRDAFVVDRNIE